MKTNTSHILWQNAGLAAFLLIIVLSVFERSAVAQDDDPVLRIYHDADWVNLDQASEAIWRGAHVALSEVDYQAGGYRIELVKRNHSGSVLRSLANLHAFLDDQQAFAVLAGMHSPPLIKNRAFINENEILTLVPWAAGGPITRYADGKNWVFRLSVDDTKAGEVLISEAAITRQCQSIHLLLEDTPWGDSNLQAMNIAANDLGISIAGVRRFSWGTRQHTALSLVETIATQGGDCVIYVGNSMEGVEFALALSKLPEDERPAMISHWGITGGDFEDRVAHDHREAIDLSFIQTCFSFFQTPLSSKGRSVLASAKTAFPEHINEPLDIEAPNGFIHAYDLISLLIQALNDARVQGQHTSISELRHATHRVFENFDTNVQGLIKMYDTPFQPFSSITPDAHEALGADDICMARYGEQNEIRLYD